MLTISGKLKTENRFKPFDYEQGNFVVNLIHATMWLPEQQEHVQQLVDHMNKGNPEYVFKLVNRG